MIRFWCGRNTPPTPDSERVASRVVAAQGGADSGCDGDFEDLVFRVSAGCELVDVGVGYPIAVVADQGCVVRFPPNGGQVFKQLLLCLSGIARSTQG
jgi:hypothetical protein